MKKIITKENITLLILGIIIFCTFLYGSYKIQITLTNNGQINICYTILIITSIIAFLISIYTYNVKNIKPEVVFLIIVPIFCIMLTMAMPMSKGHDETIHGLRIYEYAEGKFISNGENAYLEEGITNAIDNKPTYASIFKNEKTYSTETSKIEWGYRIAAYSPITYFPQVIGILIGRVFTTNSMIHFYLARILNIATCIIMLYYAIKIIPYGKNMMLLLCSIPIAIEGFSTLSADGILIASSFLFIAYILKLREEKNKPISKKDIILISVLALIIALTKTIYIVILPIVLLIPKEKFKTAKLRNIFIVSLLIICAILDIGWYFIGIQKESVTTNIENNPVEYIISNPIGYAKKLIYTIVTNGTQYIQEMFGYKIEWNEAITIPVFPNILLIFSILISAKGEDKIKLKKAEKLLIYIILLVFILLVFTSMFVAWSKMNVAEIMGIQGRYFIPILPLAFLLIGKFLDNSKITKLIAILTSIMQIYVIIELVLYHI